MFKLGLPELIVIFLAVILLFGAKALPEIASGLAKAIKNFRKGMQEIGDDAQALKKNKEVVPPPSSHETNSDPKI